MSRKHYAEQSPRGFFNEVNIHVFTSRAARDAWVDAHANDGDCNSAACGARACSYKRAREILERKSDALTTQHNARIEM